MKTFEILAGDYEERYGKAPTDWATILIAALRTREFTAVLLYRFYLHLCRHRRIIPGLRAFVYHILRSSYGVDIHQDAIIGSGFVIHHAHMIVIGNGVTIGEQFHAYHGITIGAKNSCTLDDWPKLGDRVTIYTGSVIAGSVIIGNDVIIGAHSLVITDIPSNSVTYGQRASLNART